MDRADRRTVLSGLAASMAASLGKAAPAQQATLAVGDLAGNPIARRFFLPAVKLDTRRTATVTSDVGVRNFHDLRGKVRLVSLWAEWCAPCLFELPDLTGLNARFRREGFEVVAVLTGSAKRLTWPQAHALIESRGPAPPLWVEPNGGDTWLTNLANGADGPSLPCNLIVDRGGRIRARSFGASSTAPLTLNTSGGRLTQAGKAQLLSSEARSTWSTAAADDFVRSLLRGAIG